MIITDYYLGVPVAGRWTRKSMSRADHLSRRPGGETLPPALGERAQTAEEIGREAALLAQRARAAGMTAIGHLLEMASSEASAEAMLHR